MPEKKQTKYRHELKYQVTDAQIQMLKNRIHHLLPLDSHVAQTGSYFIRSLYFDDYDNRCMKENENGTDPREKFRIRIYNGSAEKITLECKRKERGKTHKTSCPLTEEQTRQLMAGNILPDIGQQPLLLRKLTLQMMTGFLSFIKTAMSVSLWIPISHPLPRWKPSWTPGLPPARYCRWARSCWK